jgi:futalosine hydrolase
MNLLGLVCSVEIEAHPLVRMLSGTESLEVGKCRGWRGILGGRNVLLLACGMGKANAAHGLTALLERFRPKGLIATGVGGAYVGSGLDVCDIAVAEAEIYADEGVETPDGWRSCEEIGIPLAPVQGTPLFNHFPLERERVRIALDAIRGGGQKAFSGPFVTASTCSGTLARGNRLRDRYQAICESMEGAAFAHVAALYQVPFLEVRGISNLVEDRDRERWRIEDAASAAAQAVAATVSTWA